MVSTRSKRWNGSVDTLPVDYLKGVLERMLDYGDRVRFSLTSGGPQPSYQVVNTQEKTMIFDRNHHLLQAQSEDFVGANATNALTLTQIEAAINGTRTIGSGTRARSASVARSTGSGGATRSTAAKVQELFAAERYEYFKANREFLPASISKHSNEITALMKSGKTVAEAFDEVANKYPG